MALGVIAGANDARELCRDNIEDSTAPPTGDAARDGIRASETRSALRAGRAGRVEASGAGLARALISCGRNDSMLGRAG